MTSNYPPGMTGNPTTTDYEVPQTCKNGHVWTTPMYSELGGAFYVDETDGPICPFCQNGDGIHDEEALDDPKLAEERLKAAESAGIDIPHVGPEEPVGQPDDFQYADREFSCHLRCSKAHNGSIYVAAHTDSYGHSLKFLAALAEHLKAVIANSGITATFEEFEVEKLGGQTYKNIFSVQTRITYTDHDKKAVKALRRQGFYEPLEYIL